MKQGIFVVNANDQLQPNAHRSIAAAANRWQCDLLVVQTSSSPLHPACWKTEAFERAAVYGIEQVLILDADIVVSAFCPNPFHFFAEFAGRMVVVNDRQTHNPARDKAEIDEVEIMTGARTRLENYFNSGVILADVAYHRELFASAARRCEAFPHLCWHDQTPFNVSANVTLDSTGVRSNLHYADETWNFHNPAGRIEGWQRMKKFIYHFPGNPDRNKQIEQVDWR